MVGTGDFNQDGKPDIAWHHVGSGQVVIWYMNGSVLISGTLTTPESLPDTNWRVVGVADFNGDGKPDLFWHHQTSGQLLVWYLNNATQTGTSTPVPGALTDLNWRVAAVGDYDSDTKPDLVWRHGVFDETVIWFMDGVALVGGAYTSVLSGDVNWKVVGPR